MANKSTGKNYTSKGERRSSMRTRSTDPAVKLQNVQRAYWKGQNPWVTIDNPSKEQTNKRKIRVRANELWGSPKEREKQRYYMS